MADPPAAIPARPALLSADFPSLRSLTSLHTIPLPHTITPTPPNSPPRAGPDRNTPRLAGAFNVYREGLEGKVVENPWRVVVGPVGEAAREEWKGDGGKGWVRGKVEGGGGWWGGGYGGGGGGFGGGWGRGGRGVGVGGVEVVGMGLRCVRW